MEKNGMYSIIIDESQFIEKYDCETEYGCHINYDEPKRLTDFKKRCAKAFGESAIIEYGAGQLEVIISNDNFIVFQQIADAYDVTFNVDDIVEF